MAEIRIKRIAGDTLPKITGVVKNAGVAVDITGWTIQLLIERPTTLLTKTATLLSPTAGTFEFSFSASDFVSGKNQDAHIRTNNGAGGIKTRRNCVFDVDPKKD